MEDSNYNREKVQKIKNIIEKEIDKELISKQNEVSDISEKIKIILRNLDLLKYIVAVNYYDQNTTLTPKKGQEDEKEEEKAQNQIHPCIKKLMPYRSNYNKSFGDAFISHSYDTRNSKKINFSEGTSVDIKKEVSDNGSQESSSIPKLPHYVPPLPKEDDNVEKINSMRGSVSKKLYRITVGNVSKWIAPDTREDNSTHKWMVYIRSKDSSKDVTKLLRKVRYFLHESYKPHDIIDVTSPPFHLTRRGWGEFPVRVQLHFTHPLNKPVDIIHNLKLDSTYTGIQTLGSETTIEVFLHPSNSHEKDASKSNSKILSTVNEVTKEKQDVYDPNLITNINGLKPVTEIKQEPDTEVIMKKEPENSFPQDKYLGFKAEEMNTAINNSRKYLLDRRKTMKIIEIEHNYLKSSNSIDKSSNDCANLILKLEAMKNNAGGEKTFKNGSVFDSVLVNQIINRKNQERLSKIEIRANKSEEEIFKSLKSVANKLERETQSKYCMKVFRNMYLVNVVQRAQATKLRNVELLVKWFVQRWPIITKLSLDPTYKTIHPYSSPSEEEFLKYNIGKQRSAEWFRAKAIQKVLKSLKLMVPIEEEIWSTKQILLWSRFHGYSPSSFQKTAVKESTDFNEFANKRLKPHESSSDSDDGSWDKRSKKFKTDDEKFLNDLTIGERKRTYKKSRRKEEEVHTRHKNYKNCNTWSEASDCQRFGVEEFRVLQAEDCDGEIDVVEVDKKEVKESPTKRKEAALTVLTTPSNEVLFNKFVCDTVREIGIKLMEEEAVPGVKCNSVSRVVSQCASSFLEELLRRSFAQAWSRNGHRCPESLEENDILATIIEHPRYDIFTNRGLGTASIGKS